MENVEFSVRFAEVKSLEEARNYILELVAHLEEARAACNIVIPDNHHLTVQQQKKAHMRFLIKYGQALGSLTTLCHTRTINDQAYDELRRRIEGTLVPTIVGVNHGLPFAAP